MRLAMVVLLPLVVIGASAPVSATEQTDPVYQAEDYELFHAHDDSFSLQGFKPEHSRVNSTSSEKPVLYLTFDDGSSELSPQLLDMLDAYPHVQVTFFVNCREEVAGTFNRILASGHALGNHTCNHEMLSDLSSTQRMGQFNRLQEYVNGKLRADLPLGCYRPPFGGTNDDVRADAKRAGLWEWTWSIDPRDWEKPGVDKILSSLETMRDGDIIVLHDSNGKEQTVEAVRRFLEQHASDYLFRPLPHCAGGQPREANGSFYDDDSSSFEMDIEWLATAGITKGCGEQRFCPDDPVTRGQMAAFLVRALGLSGGHFSLVDTAGHVFEQDISALAEAGITRGCNPPENDRFCPDEPVSRAQMAAFLVRALGLPVSDIDSFVDDDGLVFEPDIQALAASGVTRGCNPPAGNRFCPAGPITRGEMAAMLHRALK